MPKHHESEQPIQQIIAGRYAIIRLISKGFLGQVFLAHDRHLNRSCVLKGVEFGDDRAQALLLRERRILAKMRHPALTAVYDTVLDEGVVYLVLEFVEGETLDSILRSGPLTSLQFVSVYAPLAQALEYLHSNGIVHRDLKPSNVIISPQYTPTIIDFGLAVSSEESDMLTAQGTIVGTPAYIAPEILRNTRVGPQADVYSLGIMMFESLTGECTPSGSIGEILSLRSRGVIPSNFDDLLSSAGALKTLIRQMLSPDPDDRPTAASVAVTLEKIRKQQRLRVSGKNILSEVPFLKPALFARPLSLIISSIILIVLFWTFRELITIVLLLAVGMLLMVAGWFMRKTLPPDRVTSLPTTAEIERRIAAIEHKLTQVDTASESLVVSVEALRSELSTERLKDVVCKSVLIALQELEVGSPTSDLGVALKVISGLTSRSRSFPWYKRTAGLLTIAGTAATLVASIVGIAMTTNLWHPNSPPRIIGIGRDDLRATRSAPVELLVLADDPDGDSLRYDYEASEGTIIGQGALVVWRSNRNDSSDFVSVTVRVSDRKGTVSKTRTLRINNLPEVKLSLPSRARPGAVIRIAVDGTDPDGDKLHYSWHVSGEMLSDPTSAEEFFALPTIQGPLLVKCSVFDGWESVELSGEIPIVADRSEP